MGFWSGMTMMLVWCISLLASYKVGYANGVERAEEDYEDAGDYVNYVCGDCNDMVTEHPKQGDIVPFVKELKEDGIITS